MTTYLNSMVTRAATSQQVRHSNNQVKLHAIKISRISTRKNIGPQVRRNSTASDLKCAQIWKILKSTRETKMTEKRHFPETSQTQSI